MIILFSILLYPIFFIISYALGEYIFPTRNTAMIVAIVFSLSVSYLYYTIRVKVSQQKQAKISRLSEEKTRLTQLLLVERSVFDSYFDGTYDLPDNSINGLNEEKLLAFLRKNGLKSNVEIYSINKMTEGCNDLLKLLNVSFTVHSPSEIIDKTAQIEAEPIECSNEGKIAKIKRALFSRQFKSFAIKYGVILLVFSLFTPYRIYYLLFGFLLIAWNVFLSIRAKSSLIPKENYKSVR